MNAILTETSSGWAMHSGHAKKNKRKGRGKVILALGTYGGTLSMPLKVAPVVSVRTQLQP